MAEPAVDREGRPTGERVSSSLFAAWDTARLSDLIALATTRLLLHATLHANLEICAILAILANCKSLFP
jgi:hypothetical protein